MLKFIYNFFKLLERFECWLKRINVGRIIATHTRGYVNVKIVSWENSKVTTYYEGKLATLRCLKWKVKRKLYRQRIYEIDASFSFLVIQIWKEKPKLKLILDKELAKLKKSE